MVHQSPCRVWWVWVKTTARPEDSQSPCLPPCCGLASPNSRTLASRRGAAELARRGLAGCTLWVLEENAPARRFYERLGMRTDGGRRMYPGTAVPEVRYRLALAA